MSKITSQRFSNEDFPEQQSWIGKMFTPLNMFFGDVIRAFSNGISVEDNLFQEIKEIKWVNSPTNFPVKFRTKFKTQPRGLVPIYLANNTDGVYSNQAPWVEWAFQDSEITIPAISGLTAGKTYTIRLLVIYG